MIDSLELSITTPLVVAAAGFGLGTTNQGLKRFIWSFIAVLSFGVWLCLATLPAYKAVLQQSEVVLAALLLTVFFQFAWFWRTVSPKTFGF